MFAQHPIQAGWWPVFQLEQKASSEELIHCLPGPLPSVSTCLSHSMEASAGWEWRNWGDDTGEVTACTLTQDLILCWTPQAATFFSWMFTVLPPHLFQHSAQAPSSQPGRSWLQLHKIATSTHQWHCLSLFFSLVGLITNWHTLLSTYLFTNWLFPPGGYWLHEGKEYCLIGPCFIPRAENAAWCIADPQ